MNPPRSIKYGQKFEEFSLNSRTHLVKHNECSNGKLEFKALGSFPYLSDLGLSLSHSEIQNDEVRKGIWEKQWPYLERKSMQDNKQPKMS